MNNLSTELTGTHEWTGIQLTTPTIVVHDGPHRLLSTSPFPSQPYSVPVDSHATSAVDSLNRPSEVRRF
jgi:hypothetical protein